MNDLDLTTAKAAVSAALLAHDSPTHLGDEVPADEYDCCSDVAIAAAAPLIEAAVRELVAREIEDEARNFRRVTGAPRDGIVQRAYRSAARIALGQRAREREAFSGLLEAEGGEES